MTETSTDTLARLLSRGGRALGLAAIAHARKHKCADMEWYALGEDLSTSAEQIMGVIEERGNAASLAHALKAAMSPGPATRAPSWTLPLLERADAIAEIGRRIRPPFWPHGAGPLEKAADRARGLASLAIALCRSMDSIAAVAAGLPRNDAEELVRMGALAQTLVSPGKPSQTKREIVHTIQELYGNEHGKTDSQT